MKRRHQRTLAIGAAGSLTLMVMALAPTAVAADGDVHVVNTETVQIYTSPTGKVETKRIYEQLALTGSGSVSLLNPVETKGLRNLDGFGGLNVKDGLQTVKTSVDGSKNFRTVSDYTGDPPLSISVEYLLDGSPVSPGDVVGKKGHLKVTYSITNETGQPQTISFDDGAGNTVTKDVEIPVPYVASLDVTLPANFRNVSAPAANMAGDGVGGTIASFTMTLFPPLSSGTATLTYEADITDGVVPRASLTALPVDPLASPTFATAAEGYAGGADSGKQLADGATQIDSNLLKLRDGAASLLSGLVQLRDGSGKASTGSQDLTDGLQQISDGLGALADTQSGLPSASAGISQLQDGVDQLLAGLGTASNANTIIGGLVSLNGGLKALKAGQGDLVAGLQQLVDNTSGLPAAKGGVDLVKAGLDAALAPGGDFDTMAGALGSLLSAGVCSVDPTCSGTVTAILTGASGAVSDLNTASAALGQVSAGLGTAIAGLNGLIIPGAQQINAGLAEAKAGGKKLQSGAKEVKGGLRQVSDGLDELAAGISDAVVGVLQLSAGADSAYAGSQDLTTGLDAISGGLTTAADGAPDLVSGAQRLSDEGTKELVSSGKDTAASYGELYSTMQAVSARAVDESMIVGAPDGSIGLAAFSYEIQGESGESTRNLERTLAGIVLLGAAAGVIALRRRMA